MKNRKRIFILGCPRSGTTLVQSIVSKHEGFKSFPESHVFTDSVIGLRHRMYGYKVGYAKLPMFYAGAVLNYLGFASPKVKERIPVFLEQAGLVDELEGFKNLPLKLRPLLTRFIELLDKQSGEDGWIEKTPNNLFCLDLIEKYVPEAYVIHVMRDGEATIASIADAAQKYDEWKKWLPDGPKGISRLCEMWNKGTKISKSYSQNPRHLMVKHENLTEDPEREIKRIAGFLDIPFSEELMDLNRMRSSFLLKNGKIIWGAQLKKLIQNLQKFFLSKSRVLSSNT